MKIFILTHTFPRNEHDSTAAFMKGFADSLVRAGNNVTVITPFDTKFKRKNDPFEIVTYKYAWPDNLHVLGYSRTMEADVALRKRAYFLLPFFLISGTIAIFKAIKRQKPDIINAHWALPNGVIALIASILTATPYVISIPGTDAYLARRYKIFGIIAKIVAQNSWGIISNSSWNLKRIIGLGVRNIPTDIINYPADISMFKPNQKGLDPLRKKLGLNKENFIVLGVGRLVYKKGFEYLIDAISLLRNKYPNIRLIIGGDGDLMTELREKAKNKSIVNKVIFAGDINRDEISNYYNLSDVFVAPSIIDDRGNTDGGPVVSLESMACGKPQILTNVLGMADVIKDGINGYVVPQKNPKALADAMEKFIVSPKLRYEMGRKNILLARQTLSLDKIGKEYTEFFKKVLSK